MRLPEFKSAPLLHNADELPQIGSKKGSLCQNMKVVRHRAVGVQFEPVARRALNKNCNETSRIGGLCQVGISSGANYGD